MAKPGRGEPTRPDQALQQDIKDQLTDVDSADKQQQDSGDQE